MPTDPPPPITLPPASFPQGPHRDGMLDLDSPTDLRPPRVSFGQTSYRRPSQASRGKFTRIDEELGEDLQPILDLPSIPSAIPKGDDTPLPMLPMIVLSIAMLGEFLSANVSTPFLLFMVEGFGGEDNDENRVGYLTGILVSMFFITQFATSLLWATVAEKHGRRAVLFLSLLGTALTCCSFGTATNFPQAVAIRLMQGVFGGSVGVARGAVTAITDSSNEARAYAILGFCWGLGGVAGAVIGGAFESPAVKWPNGVGSWPILVRYPYLLPCAIAASITFIGAILSLFLGWDGGPREGLIRLPIEKDDDIETPAPTNPEELEMDPSPSQFQDDHPRNVVGQLRKQVSKKLSGYFARRVREAHGGYSPLNSPSTTSLQAPQALAIPRQKDRSYSRASRTSRTGPGSAYGYGTAFRSPLSGSLPGGRSSSMGTARIRRFTGQTENGEVTEDLTFAQRLVLATEGNVTNMANLWVAAAINADNDDPFVDSGSEDDDHESVFMEEDGAETPSAPQTPPRSRPSSQTRPTSGSRPGRTGLSFMSPIHSLTMTPQRPSISAPPPNLPATTSSVPPHTRIDRHLTPLRRGSAASHSYLPAIYSNTGLATPPALALDSQISPGQPAEIDPLAQAGATLAPPLSLTRTRSRSPSHPRGHAEVHTLPPISEGELLETAAAKLMTEVEPSLWSQLPMIMIFQYGALAFHNTIHDQYFLSYLVSPYASGGLGLDAGHFAQLIALMCLAQIFYQFYLYPNIGPPRGAWSHLAMFRIGATLFIPSYLSVCLYRVFASDKEDGNGLVMTLLALSTAIRYCGTTFSYTAIAILLNYMSPPHLVSYSNSLAQSTVALARFVGPVIGGYLWSASVKDSPSGYPYGFYICSAICGIAILHSFTIR